MTLTLTLAQVYAYSEMEQMVRECTCNDAQTPSEMLMREIAKGTFTVEFSAIMAIVWKRIKDKTNEHHAYKCLVLLTLTLALALALALALTRSTIAPTSSSARRHSSAGWAASGCAGRRPRMGWPRS